MMEQGQMEPKGGRAGTTGHQAHRDTQRKEHSIQGILRSRAGQCGRAWTGGQARDSTCMGLGMSCSSCTIHFYLWSSWRQDEGNDTGTVKRQWPHFWNTYVLGTMPGTCHARCHSVPTWMRGRLDSLPHLTGKEPEAQRAEQPAPRSHSWSELEQDLDPGSGALRLALLTITLSPLPLLKQH